jgi:uncharacterized membrane-anchored protein YjiN (DUF445 family)
MKKESLKKVADVKSSKKVADQVSPLTSKSLPKSDEKKVKEVKADPEKEKAISDAKQKVSELEQIFADAKSKLADAKKALRSLTGGKHEKKGPGVITSILSLVTSSGKKGISKTEILAKLVEMFPDRAEESMEHTISVQLPGRLSKEKGVNVQKTEAGAYYIAD